MQNFVPAFSSLEIRRSASFDSPILHDHMCLCSTQKPYVHRGDEGKLQIRHRTKVREKKWIGGCALTEFLDFVVLTNMH